MKTLTRETKKIREGAMPSAEPGRDGDKFWLREFNAEQSIERYQCLDEQCQHFERRGTEFKVKCGLELYRSKLNLHHGEWYLFLKKAHTYPSTATRRMQVALDFMIWAGVIRPEEKVKEQHIITAMEISYLKSCILHDFAEYKHESFNENEFNAEMLEVEGKKERKPWLKPSLIINWRSIPGSEDRELGFDPIELSQFIKKHLGDFPLERQAKIIEELRLTVDILRVLLHDLKVHYEPEIKKLISSLPKKRDAEIDALSKMLAFLQPDSYRQSNL